MTAQTGRTVGKWVKVQIDDVNGVLRDIPVATIGGVGIAHDQVDLSALQDVLKGFLPGHGTVAIPITGPFDTKAAATASVTTEAPALSGSHTVLSALNGRAVPLTFGIYFGMRHYWEAGEPVFGGQDCLLLFDYQVNPDGTYSANLGMSPGAASPAWGTAAITT